MESDPSYSFKTKPVLVFWETTKACLLSCHHCRASAQPYPLPGQLSTSEATNLLHQIREFGEPYPVVIFTGGDPLMRPDLFYLLEKAKQLGLHTAVSPSVTPLLTEKTLERFKEYEVGTISISIDGANSRTHDTIRGVDGTFLRSLGLLREANELGMKVQVNTTVMRTNLRELAHIFHLVRENNVMNWEVFFLIRTGRALERLDPTPYECEDVCNFLYDTSCYDVTIRAIEAPFIRRIALSRNGGPPLTNTSLYHYLHSRLLALEGQPRKSPAIRSVGTLDGDGIIFVGFNGEIFPGGFVPCSVGNVRKDSLVRTYRENPLLIGIRNREFKGKCGNCEYRFNCGGSRARAYAHHGDPLASDDACPYMRMAPLIG